MDQEQMFEQLYKRFDRMEGKIDVLSETVVQLARIEERQTNQSDAITRIGKTLDKHETRMEGIEDEVDELQAKAQEAKPVFSLIKYVGAGILGGGIAKLTGVWF
jgi:uncharacterized coiled-coil protein SlyX